MSTTVAQVLAARTWRWRDELDLHESIGGVLGDAGLQFEREVRLSARDRIDFLVQGGVGVEVKVAGSAAAVLRQLERYGEHTCRIDSLVLFTTRAAHLCLAGDLQVRMALDVRNVPVEVVRPSWV